MRTFQSMHFGIFEPVIINSSASQISVLKYFYRTCTATEGGGSITSQLQEANIDVYTIPECEAVWGESEIEDDEHVCVGMGGQGSCNVSLSIARVTAIRYSVHRIHWRTRGGGGGRQHGRVPLGPFFFYFHVVFVENWPKW